MSVALLDVNVLVSLFDPAHPGHEAAHDWFGRNRKQGWATCPLTINGCVRVLSNPAYPTVEATPSQVIAHLRTLCARADHHFWEQGVSLLDPALFRQEALVRHQSITDVYLLGLAIRNRGRLATFDRGIAPGPVIGAESTHLVLLGSTASTARPA